MDQGAQQRSSTWPAWPSSTSGGVSAGTAASRARIEGQCVLITGAGGGIGREISVSFALAGAAHIILWDLSLEGMEQTALAVREAAGAGADGAGPRVRCFEVDVSDRQAVYAGAGEVQQYLRGILPGADLHVSILVNNAGLGTTGHRLLAADDARIEKIFGVNALAHFWTVKAFLPAMQSRNAGHIVTVASFMGLIALPRMADYSASKHAAVGFAESLRRELQQDGYTGIGTTCICPTHVETKMFRGFRQPLIPSLTPRTVARAVVDAVCYHREVVSVPRVASFFAVLNACLPTAFMDWAGRLMKTGEGADLIDKARADECAGLMQGSLAKRQLRGGGLTWPDRDPAEVPHARL